MTSDPKPRKTRTKTLAKAAVSASKAIELPPDQTNDLRQPTLEEAAQRVFNKSGTPVSTLPRPMGKLTLAQMNIYHQVGHMLINLRALSAEDVLGLEELAVALYASRLAREKWSQHQNLTEVRYNTQGYPITSKHPDYTVMKDAQTHVARLLAVLGLTPKTRIMLAAYSFALTEEENKHKEKPKEEKPHNPFDDLPDDDDE